MSGYIMSLFLWIYVDIGCESLQVYIGVYARTCSSMWLYSCVGHNMGDKVVFRPIGVCTGRDYFIQGK
jgi:hypothetical protein